MPLRKQASSRHSCPWSQSNASIGIDWLLPKIRVCNPHKKSLIAFASKNKITPRVRQSNRKERTLRARLGDRCLRSPHHGKAVSGAPSVHVTLYLLISGNIIISKSILSIFYTLRHGLSFCSESKVLERFSGHGPVVVMF